VSSKVGDQTFSTSYVAPIFGITTAKTQVMMKSGETIAIGGLLTDNMTSAETKVPYLGDIPLVGKLLFKSKRQSPGSGNEKVETLFFVTVTSVDSRGQPISDSDRKDDLSSQDQAKAPDNKAASPNAPSAANAQKTAA
jgi:type II secretory pathway component GspD/PulD (secretin)